MQYRDMPFTDLVRAYAAADQAYAGGCFGAGDMRVLAGAGEEIRRRLDEADRRIASARAYLFERLAALGDGSLEGARLFWAVKEIVERYLFLCGYVCANRGAAGWHELVDELLADEEAWLEDAAPAVRALFEAHRQSEALRRVLRENGVDCGDGPAPVVGR
ncbi:MAG: hypothetical protein ACPLRW_05545 [Moorellales bacterium]